MSDAHPCLLQVGASLRHAEFWLDSARRYDFNDVDLEHAEALERHARDLANEIKSLNERKTNENQ